MSMEIQTKPPPPPGRVSATSLSELNSSVGRDFADGHGKWRFRAKKKKKKQQQPKIKIIKWSQADISHFNNNWIPTLAVFVFF